MTPQEWLAALAAIVAATPLKIVNPDEARIFRRSLEYYNYNRYSIYVSLSKDGRKFDVELIHDHLESRDKSLTLETIDSVIETVNRWYAVSERSLVLEALGSE